MPKIPDEKRKTLKQTVSIHLPVEFSIKDIAKKLNISQGELVRQSVKEFAKSQGII